MQRSYYLFVVKYPEVLQGRRGRKGKKTETVNVSRNPNNNKKTTSTQMRKFPVDPLKSKFIDLAIIGVRHDDACRSRDIGIAGNCTEE